MISKSDQLSFVLPCKDEVGNIGRLINEIRAIGYAADKHQIIIIDDGSTDGTSELLRNIARKDEGIKILFPEKRLGLGQSVRLGILESNTEYVAVLDSDGMHNPSYLPLMSIQCQNNHKLVIGSRLIAGGKMHGALYPFFSLLINRIIKVVTDSEVHDQLCGFFVAPTNLLREIPKECFDGFGEYFMYVTHYFEKHFTGVVELPTIHEVRNHGVRKSRRMNMAKSYLRTSFRIRKLI